MAWCLIKQRDKFTFSTLAILATYLHGAGHVM